MEPALILLVTHILIDIDMPMDEAVALRSPEKRERVETWLEGFRRWPVDDAIARESVGPSRPPPGHANSRDFPLGLGGVVPPHEL